VKLQTKAMTTPTDIKSLSTFLKDDSLAGYELTKALLTLGQSKHDTLKSLVQELVSSGSIAHSRYAALIATGAGDVDTLLQLARHESPIVLQTAAHGLSLHATKEQLSSVFENDQVVLRLKTLLLQKIKQHRRELIMDFVPTTYKLYGADEAIRMLAFVPESINDEELAKQIESYKVMQITHYSTWIRRRPRVIIQFLKNLYARLASNTDEKIYATVALNWNSDAIQQLMKTANATIASELIDLIVEIAYTQHKKLSAPTQALDRLFGSRTGSYAFRKCPDKMIECLKEFSQSYSLESMKSILGQSKKIFFQLPASMATTLFDVLYNKIKDKSVRSADGQVLVQYLLSIQFNTNQAQKNREKLYTHISTTYGVDAETFFLENLNWERTIRGVHPIIGNAIAQRKLEQVKQSKQLDTQEESKYLEYTNPFQDEKNHKHFESMCSNPTPNVRSQVLANYWRCAFYNKSNMKQVTEFVAKRLTNEPVEVKDSLLGVMDQLIEENIQVFDREELFSSVEKIVHDACYGSKAGGSSKYYSSVLVFKIISNHNKTLRPRETLQHAIKILDTLTDISTPYTRYNAVKEENMDVLEASITKSISKCDFVHAKRLIDASVCPHRSTAIKKILEQVFTANGKLQQILENADDFAKLNSSARHLGPHSTVVELLHIYLKSQKNHENKLKVVQELIKVDPSLVYDEYILEVVFSTSTTSEQREAILSPYLVEKMDVKTIKSLAPNLQNLVFTGDSVTDLMAFNPKALLRTKLQTALNAKHRNQLAKTISSTMLALLPPDNSPSDKRRSRSPPRGMPAYIAPSNLPTGVVFPEGMEMPPIQEMSPQFMGIPSRNAEKETKVNFDVFERKYRFNFVPIERRFTRVNATLRIEESEQLELEEFLEIFNPKDVSVKSHATVSRIYTGTPARALSKLLEEITAENVLLVSPALRRCAQFMPLDKFLEVMKEAITNVLEKRSSPRGERMRGDERRSPRGKERKVPGVSIQKELIRTLHAFIINRTTREQVYKFVTQLWQRKNDLHKDTRAALLHVAYSIFLTQRDEHEPDLKQVLHDGINDEYHAAALSGFFLDKYLFFNNVENVQYQFTELDIKLLFHKDEQVQTKAMQEISQAVADLDYGFNVIFAKNPHDIVIEAILKIVYSFKESQGHANANSAVSTLVKVCLKDNEETLLNVIKRLLTEEEFRTINQETNGENWDLPVFYRVSQLVSAIRNELWNETVDVRTQKREFVTHVKSILKQEPVLYWQNITSLVASTTDYCDANGIVKNLIGELVQECQGENEIFAENIVHALSGLFKMEEIKSAGLDEHVVITVVEHVLNQQNSNQNAKDKLWELFAAAILKLLAEDTGRWNENVKKLVLELRARKANKLLQTMVMIPKTDNNTRGNSGRRGKRPRRF
jgi:hypothetical protein